MKKLLSCFLLGALIFCAVGCQKPKEPKVTMDKVYYLNENRRAFNRYAPYAYEYYYQDRSGNDGCGWRYTTQGLVYSCE